MKSTEEIVLIRYYNVLFYLFFEVGIDDLKRQCLVNRIGSGEPIRMKKIQEWCHCHQIPFIVSAQHRLSTAVNSAMVTTYWEIGEQIFKACGENDRAEYGKKLLEYLSEQLTAEFGKGFDKSNLRKMRQFYCTFPIRDTLCPELSWSHYRVLMRINDEQAR
ncbi:MAG: DUF1016 N-terminal domain-containing protein, partial [Ruminococcus sp.]